MENTIRIFHTLPPVITPMLSDSLELLSILNNASTRSFHNYLMKFLLVMFYKVDLKLVTILAHIYLLRNKYHDFMMCLLNCYENIIKLWRFLNKYMLVEWLDCLKLWMWLIIVFYLIEFNTTLLYEW